MRVFAGRPGSGCRSRAKKVIVPATETFSITKVNRLRRRAERSREIDPGVLVDGWQQSPVDPMELLRVFKPLRIKVGFTLRAFVLGGANANGVVWAVPEGTPMPDVDADASLFDPPRPADTIDDFMEVIDGDGSPWSYLCASILAREAVEFGARWHGCNWSTVEIVGRDPWAKGTRKTMWSSEASADRAAWIWEEPRPVAWEPTVSTVGEEIEVVFHSYTGLGQEVISRCEDRFAKGSCVFRNREVVLAAGPGGYVH